MRRWEGSSPRWTVTFLHTDGHLFRVLPDLAERMERLVRETDAKNWRLLQRSGQEGQTAETGSDMSLRCCEYHRMMQGGHLGDIHHHDEGSIITVDIMLTPSESYEGGVLSTLEPVVNDAQPGTTDPPEASEALVQHQFERGDALLFVSHKYHCVAPVIKGVRQVLVAEYWWGERRECGHRCDQHWGPCEFNPGSEKMDMFFDELVGATEGGIDVMAAAAAAVDEDSGSEHDSDTGSNESCHADSCASETPRQKVPQPSVISTPSASATGNEVGFTTPRGTHYKNVD